jgi:hypothetical protein
VPKLFVMPIGIGLHQQMVKLFDYGLKILLRIKQKHYKKTLILFIFEPSK